MKIVIRKSDNKLICWNGGNTENNSDYEEVNIAQDYLPPVDHEKYYYNPGTQEVYIKEENV